MIVHKHYEMGVAPYKFIGLWHPSSNGSQKTTCVNGYCDHCGTPISYHYIIRDSESKDFVVGSSCIAKLNDTILLSQVKNAQRKRNKELREEKRKAKRASDIARFEQEKEAERQKNGGMTDYELRRATEEARKIVIREFSEKAVSYFYEALNDSNTFFCIDVKRGLASGKLPTGRGVNITKEIAVKYHSGSRKGSKRYIAELDKANIEWNKMVGELDEIKAKVADLTLEEIQSEHAEFFI